MKELNLIEQALDKATQKGSFTLNETMMISKSLIAISEKLESNKKELDFLHQFKQEQEELKKAKNT